MNQLAEWNLPDSLDTMAFTPAQKHLFYTELAKLLEAGFGIREAAGAMLDTGLPGHQSALLEQMNAGLEAGQSITASFSADKSVTELERTLIGAGERSGRMAPAFQHLADYFGMIAAARREAARAMIYPLVILHLTIAVSAIFSASDKGGSALAAFALTLLSVYAVAAVATAIVLALLKAAPASIPVDRFLNRIPLIGKARRNLAMARFTKVYHMGILAGLTMTETAETAANSAHSGVLREAGLRIAKTAKTGNALGPAFLADSAFPKAFSRSYSTAEESGTLDKDLARWAAHYHGEAERATKSAAVVIPKVLYSMILVFVAWKIITMVTQGYENTYKALDDIDKN